MSRLLFAVARGARVQRQHEHLFHKQVWWEDVSIQWGLDDELRIHPDDEHLAYGPISTALREMAAHNPCDIRPSWELELANSAANEFTLYFDSRQGEPDYPLFYLFLAEALADSGL
jgi:hypothetical protein